MIGAEDGTRTHTILGLRILSGKGYFLISVTYTYKVLIYLWFMSINCYLMLLCFMVSLVKICQMLIGKIQDYDLLDSLILFIFLILF